MKVIMLPIDSIMFARASVSTNLICKLIIKTPTQKKTILISATNDLAPILNVLQKHFFSVSLSQERFTLHGIILISATYNHAPILNIFQKHFFSFDFLAGRFTLHGISKSRSPDPVFGRWGFRPTDHKDSPPSPRT